MAKNDKLLVHVVDDFLSEVGKPVKTNTWKQDFSYKKRVFPIEQSAIAHTDYMGIKHLFINVNESDGTYRFMEHRKLNLLEPLELECPDCHSVNQVPLDFIGAPRNQCDKCGDKISYDARNVRDLVKRKTIDTFWGIDSSHILLLMVMGIIAIGAFGGLFYLLGQNQSLQGQLNKYLPKPEDVKKDNTVTSKLVLGVLMFQ